MVKTFFGQFRAPLLMAIFLLSCQKAPEIAGSAEPSSITSPAPMDSETSNAELSKRKLLLEQLLDGFVSQEIFDKAKATVAKDSDIKTDDATRRLSAIIGYLGLETMPAKAKIGSVERDFWLAQFYFYERRFIEAAQIFSQLLDKKPGWLRARNLLARCFYFLGNTDRSFLELQYVLSNHGGEAEELLDALFLMGAIAMDSPTATKEQIEKGVGAWRTYLKLAPHSPLRAKIQDGLAGYEEKKKRQGMTIAASSGNAKADAIAALEGDDLLNAENKIRAALKRFPRDEELAVSLARVFVKSGRVSQALAEFKRVIDKNPKSVTAHHYQGMAFMMSGDPAKAIASWEKVLQLDPTYGERFNLRGRILIAQNLIRKDTP